MCQKKNQERNIEISVVIPVYGCPGALPDLYSRLKETLKKITDRYEVIFVNDACPYHSWDIVKSICEEDKHVIGINMSRNFGQIRAITAGLDLSAGEYVVVMDCDLQDRPEGIIELYEKLQEGYDIVFARRKNRKDCAVTKFLSESFYKVLNYFSDGGYDASICNFNISRRIVIDNYCKMREQNRAFTIFLKWLGFASAVIDIEHEERAEGKSSYNIKKKIKMAISFITSQSNKPLYISIYIGLFFAVFSLAATVYCLGNYFMAGDIPDGWTSIFISIYLLGGMILIVLGMIGIYIGNIFEESKGRPLYVIREQMNLNEGE